MIHDLWHAKLSKGMPQTNIYCIIYQQSRSCMSQLVCETKQTESKIVIEKTSIYEETKFSRGISWQDLLGLPWDLED